ncbi:MAG: hypothetical protein ACRDOF_10870 [Gaiellaceae bacterium]
MRRVAVAFVLVLLAAGIAGSALGAEYRRYVVRGEGISIAVPASWAATEGGVSGAVLDRLARENPKLAPFVRGLGGANSPMKFIALDRRVRDDFATNVNVVVVPVPSGIRFAQYRQTLLAELRPIVGSAPIEQSVATIHGVAAARFRYRLRLTYGRTITVQTLQYAFLRPGRSVVVTYTTLPKLSSTYAVTFKRSAASIRFAS